MQHSGYRNKYNPINKVKEEGPKLQLAKAEPQSDNLL